MADSADEDYGGQLEQSFTSGFQLELKAPDTWAPGIVSMHGHG